MNADHLRHYRAPGTNLQLDLQNDVLVSEDGQVFPIENGVPLLVWPPELSDQDTRTRNA
jgi:uncharacterized protein YbaR (Trm112 family)